MPTFINTRAKLAIRIVPSPDSRSLAREYTPNALRWQDADKHIVPRPRLIQKTIVLLPR